MQETKNVVQKPLVPKSEILSPSLHIKLGLMKQFTKALYKNGQCFQYIANTFPTISDAKLKKGVFTGPESRTLLKDQKFT